MTQPSKQSLWSFRPRCVCCIYSFCLFVVKSKTASRHFQLVLSFSLLAVSTCANHIKGAVQCGLLMPLDHIKGAVQCGLLMSSTPWPHQRCCSPHLHHIKGACFHKAGLVHQVDQNKNFKDWFKCLSDFILTWETEFHEQGSVELAEQRVLL